MSQQIMQDFADGKISNAQLFKLVTENFDLIPILFQGINSEKASVRYGCAKILQELSAKYPEKVYPYIDKFFALLNSQYRILTWNAILIISNLAAVDSQKKIDQKFEQYFALLNNEYMVTVANVAAASAKIAQAKPYLIPKITAKLLIVQEISTGPHLTDECKRVIAEKTIDSFNMFFNKVPPNDQTRILNFVNECKNSTRKTLSIKAEKFLNHWTSTNSLSKNSAQTATN